MLKLRKRAGGKDEKFKNTWGNFKIFRAQKWIKKRVRESSEPRIEICGITFSCENPCLLDILLVREQSICILFQSITKIICKVQGRLEHSYIFTEIFSWPLQRQTNVRYCGYVWNWGNIQITEQFLLSRKCQISFVALRCDILQSFCSLTINYNKTYWTPRNSQKKFFIVERLAVERAKFAKQSFLCGID